MPCGCFILDNRLIDLFRTPITFAHCRIGIIGIGLGARREVEGLQSLLFCPKHSRFIIPFIGWNIVRYILFFNSKFLHFIKVSQEILFKFLTVNQQAVSFNPVGI